MGEWLAYMMCSCHLRHLRTPVSYTDQDGRVTAFDRDAFGRVLKEKFADGSEVAYTYDAFGRRTSVLDEN